MVVVVTGNPFDGLTIHGPFDDREEAITYASEHLDDNEWYVIELVRLES